MLRSDEEWLSLTDSFYSAAVDGSRWYNALDRLAVATGSRGGELISIGPDAAVPINLMTNVDPGLHEAFVACGGADPAINPRVKAGMQSPVLKVMAEEDFLTPDEYRAHPHYQEFARPWDIPYICLATLDRREDLLIGLAVVRSERDGHITRAQREVFASVAPHVRAAVRMQMTLEGDGFKLLTGALDALAMPAFICDRSGRVGAMTPHAEQLTQAGRGLLLKQSRLRAVNDAEDRALTDAIDAASVLHGVHRPGVRTLVLHGPNAGQPPIVVDVMPLPSVALEFGLGRRVLVVARGARGSDSRRAAILQGVYGLTSAETEIALLLAKGRSTEIIAQARAVAVGTVRAQTKSVLAKLHVSRQAELVARVAEF